MRITTARAALGRIFFQRCFYLFIALLLLVASAPLIEGTPSGRLTLNVVNLLVVVAAVATVGLSVLSFVIALLLAAPTLAFQWLALRADDPGMLMWSWAFAAGLYLATLVYLLGYVFRRDVMTGDKLWGAAAAYLMLGVFGHIHTRSSSTSILLRSRWVARRPRSPCRISSTSASRC